MLLDSGGALTYAHDVFFSLFQRTWLPLQTVWEMPSRILTFQIWPCTASRRPSGCKYNFFFLYLSVQDIFERDLLNFYEENVSIFRAKKRLREAENKRRNRNRRYENVWSWLSNNLMYLYRNRTYSESVAKMPPLVVLAAPLFVN